MLDSRLYLPSPLNTDHPLAPDHWWIALPGLDGGRFWYDIGARAPAHGTLTNMTTSASGWRGTTRPGGFGEVRFDGANDYVDAGVWTATNGVSQFTVSGWLRMDALATLKEVAVHFGSSGWFVVTDQTNPAAFLLGVSTAGSDFGTTGSLLTVGQWAHWAMVYDGTQSGNANRLKFYWNGQAQALTLSGTIPATAPSPTANLLFGQFGGGRFVNGAMDCIPIHLRSLSAAEMWSLYTETRIGCPGLLRRVRSVLSGAVPVYLILREATMNGGFVNGGFVNG